MIQTIKGDLLTAKGIIVHGCNAQGVMGSGVALAIKNKWPEVFRAYKIHEDKAGLALGTISWVPVAEDVIVVNGITQEFYGRDGKHYVDEEAVRGVFQRVRKLAVQVKMSVNFPLIGCGLGGGDWTVISKIIEEELPGIEKFLWIQ